MGLMQKLLLAPIGKAHVATVLIVLSYSGPGVAQNAASPVSLVPVATGLVHPWALAFLPDGQFLVTERPGRMRVVSASGQVSPALAGVPTVAAGGQGGLLDVMTDTDFARSRRIYFCFSEPAAAGGGAGNSTALARATLAPDARSLQDVKVIFSQRPKVESGLHFGCRIVQSGDGHLFLALGERYVRKDDAQKLDNHHGKIVRITPDGAVPADNPFAKQPGALPEIWSYGHRNPQGATLGPDGKLWMHEHGPQGGDEINLPQPGRNYGWPVITYGENYGGGKMGEGTAKAGMEQPLHYWVPSIAPSGMAFLTSTRYGAAWQGSLFVGSLKLGTLHRLELAGGKVQREEKWLQGNGERIRDVRQGPDGLLYMLTDSPQGRLLRLQPN
ncbi:glucose/arabinose dehydrogenase [Acidovorax sp. 69]|uniref:PQQ-dependent sugar dehydrogenase n=1 Tax=Acidovorax sp. 69 TaxID=2035202 RepID=UPI000CAA47DC|nr:PQQ-dependent sugar dehydrogenase [Acidovorax sp. 69]PJI97625.1 glucose/arabinose dehydrogenase [Acidovorax sp. 69]